MNILGLLDSKKINYIDKGDNEIAITCPNAANHQGGVDNNPSCNINIKKLKLHCLACGFKLGEVGLSKWLLGEDLDEFQTAALSIKGRLRRLGEAGEDAISCNTEEEFTMVPPSTPFRKDYRGISAQTYELLDARYCTVGRYADRVFFKIEQNGKLLGIDARSINPNERIKYLRPKGCNAKQWLYSLKHMHEYKVTRAVLVEGIFDSINIFDKLGVPIGASYFGTNNFSQENIIQLLGLNLEYVVFLPDNDKAGLDARDKICPQIAPWITTYYVPEEFIPEGKDAGDMSREELEYCLENKVRFR